MSAGPTLETGAEPTRAERENDRALLAALVRNAAALLEHAGDLRAVVGLDDDALAALGTKPAERRRLRAAAALGRRVVESPLARGETLGSPSETQRALQSKIGGLPHEVFMVLFLDARHRILAEEMLARGTINGASVHPREVVKRALAHNAAEVVCAHNHPSGDATPSRSDRAITAKLRDALGLVEIRLVDHIVVGDGESRSLAELGWL